MAVDERAHTFGTIIYKLIRQARRENGIKWSLRDDWRTVGARRLDTAACHLLHNGQMQVQMQLQTMDTSLPIRDRLLASSRASARLCLLLEQSISTAGLSVSFLFCGIWFLFYRHGAVFCIVLLSRAAEWIVEISIMKTLGSIVFTFTRSLSTIYHLISC